MLVNVIHIFFDENVDDKDTDIVFLLVKDKKYFDVLYNNLLNNLIFLYFVQL